MNHTQPENTALALSSASSAALLMNANSMVQLERIADLMASGKSTIPQHLRGSKGDCFAITLQSMQWGMNPFSVAQKTHLVNGVLGYEAQLVAAVINSSGIVKDRFHFEWFGDWAKIIGKFKEVESRTKQDDNGKPKKFIVPDWQQSDEKGLGVRVWATIKGEQEPRTLELMMTQARTRNSTLWTEDPKQQIAYLVQKRWARLYAPDVILGVYTPDEMGEPGEVHMGMADVVPTEPTTYPEDQFKSNLPKWQEVIESGRKSPDDLIIFAQARNPTMPFTDAQLSTLRGFKHSKNASATDAQPKGEATTSTRPVQAAATATTASVPAMTYAEVADKLHAAKDQDQLNDAADLIGAVAAPDQRTDLTAIYDSRLAELTV